VATQLHFLDEASRQRSEPQATTVMWQFVQAVKNEAMLLDPDRRVNLTLRAGCTSRRLLRLIFATSPHWGKVKLFPADPHSRARGAHFSLFRIRTHKHSRGFSWCRQERRLAESKINSS
jgi:hypothetical protein